MQIFIHRGQSKTRDCDCGGDARTIDPPKSEAQRRAMWAAAEGRSTLGIPKSVGKEFVGRDAASEEYNRALEEFKKVSAAFREAQRAYRAREIGDNEYMTARKAFEAAQKKMDIAEKKEDEELSKIKRRLSNIEGIF